MKSSTGYILIFIIFYALSSSCVNDTAQTTSPEVKSPATAEDKSIRQNYKLPPEIESMVNQINANPEKVEANGVLANKVATHLIENNATKRAISILRKSIKDFYGSSKTPDNISRLLQLYASKSSVLGEELILTQALQHGKVAVPNLDKYMAKIAKDEKSITQKIAELQNSMTDTETGRLDLKQVNKFVNTVELFAMVNQSDDAAPDYLKMAAEVANSVKAYPKAIEIYDWILSKYGDTKFAPQALFMKAFTIDDQLKDKETAKRLYEEFLQKYPKNDFADDTEFLLENIGKSNEEIIQQFSNKKK